MANYSDDDEVRTVLKGFGTTAIGTADMVHYMNRADGLINARLGKIYTVPFSTGTNCPSIIRNIATQYSAYYAAKAHWQGDNQNVSKWVDFMKGEADGLLDMLYNEEMAIIGTSGAEVALTDSSGAVRSTTDGYIPTFLEDDAEDQEIDETKLEDIADDRDSQ